MITLAEAKQSRITQISSACADSPEFLSLVNEATRRYLNRGDFPDTMADIYVCVQNGCLVAPRYVGQIRRINYCNRTVPVENAWWRFMPSNQHECGWRQWLGPEISRLEQRGKSPVFTDIQGDGRLIYAYCRCNADIGKTVQIFGTDNNGQPLQTANPDGTFSMGITLILASPFVSSTTYVRHIDYVLKDVTQQPINLYAYNVAANVLEDLAQYDPGETHPEYSRYHLSLTPWQFNTGTIASPACCGTSFGVILRVKLKFIPAMTDTDLLPISADVLKKLVMSIKAEEADNIQMAKLYEADAVKEANLQSYDDVQEEQFSVNNDVLGPRVWRNTCF